LVRHQLSKVRQPLWFRSLITLWGIWFATALTEPAGFLACPMHSSAGHHTTEGHGAIAPVVEAAHPRHDVHAAALVTETSATESQAPTPAHICSCLGDCCSSVPARPAHPVRAPAFVVVGPDDRGGPALDALVAPTRRDHALPFAVGPPMATNRLI